MKPFTSRLIQRMAEVIFLNDMSEKPYIDTLESAITAGDVWGDFVASVYVIKGKENINNHRFSLRRVWSRHSSEIKAIITELKHKAQKHKSADQSSQEDIVVSNLLATVQCDKTNQVLLDMANAITSNESDDYMSELEKFTPSNEIWKDFVKIVIQKKDPRTIASNTNRIFKLFNRKKETIKLLVKSIENNDNLEKTEIISSDDEDEDELINQFKKQSIQDNCKKYELVNIFTECTKYPADYKKLKFAIDGININAISLKTLCVNCWLDDNIVNGFLKLFEFNFENPKVLLFDSFFVQNLISNGTLSEPWLVWASRKNLWGDTTWILPVHQEEPPHWSIMIVATKKKKILYLDSLHGALPGQLLHNICQFMAMFFKNGTINWSQWTLHVPGDVPLQTGVNKSSGNCGLHLLSWAYIIFSGVPTVFHEKNMKSVRRRIAQAFVDYASGGFNYSSRRSKQNRNQWKSVDELEIKDIKEDRGAGVGADSTFEFCASLAR